MISTGIVFALIIVLFASYASQSYIKVVIRPVDKNNVVGPNIIITERRYQKWIKALAPYIVPLGAFALGWTCRGVVR